MKALPTVLRKTIVEQFYRQNAGLFFVVLMLAGSFLRAQEHIALAEAAVHTPFMLGLYQMLWLAYTLFATRFAVGVIRQTDVLYYFRLVPTPRRWLGLLAAQLVLLTPILVYATFVGWISVQQRTGLSTVQLIAGAVLMLVLPVFWLDYALKTPNRQSLTANVEAAWRERFTTPYPLFFIRYLLSDQPVLVFLTKGGTVLLMLGILNLYPTDDYDVRLLALGLLFVAVSHSSMMYHLYQFEHERLSLLRNLPIPVSRRLGTYALIIALLLLPEGILLLRYRPIDLSIGVIAGVWAFGHSLMLLLFTVLFVRHRQPDQMLPVVFALLLAGFLTIMYQLPLWGLSVLGWAIAIGLFTHYYPRSTWETASAE